MTTPIIRLATPEDVPSVLSLWVRAGAVQSATDDPESVRRALDSGSLLVADDGGAIVGTLVAAFDGWRGNMYRLAVHPAHRRQGLGRALVTAGEARLSRQGCVRITALVMRDETGSATFWGEAGYLHDERVVRFVKTRQE